MLALKKKGYQFPELEAKGWLEGWEDDDPVLDSSSTVTFGDWTLKDIQNFESFKGPK